MVESYYQYYLSPTGWLEIKASEQNIQQLWFVEKAEEPTLHQPTVIKSCIDQLDAYFKGKLKVFDLPCLPAGTDFQRRVWDELQTISYATTLSYLNFARKLGDEKSIRAAAHANGQNPIAIIIPCHRVIGSNGSLTGYAGGLHRKQWLLDHEAKVNGTFSRLF